MASGLQGLFSALRSNLVLQAGGTVCSVLCRRLLLGVYFEQVNTLYRDYKNTMLLDRQENWIPKSSLIYSKNIHLLFLYY